MLHIDVLPREFVCSRKQHRVSGTSRCLKEGIQKREKSSLHLRRAYPKTDVERSLGYIQNEDFSGLQRVVVKKEKTILSIRLALFDRKKHTHTLTAL